MTLETFVAGVNEASLKIFVLKDRSMNNKKKCRRCSQVKVIAEFVDDSGARNPRGRYCSPCHLKREKEWRERAWADERAKLPKFKIMYCKYWKHYALPHDFSFSLREERDFCPYCGDSRPSKNSGANNPSDMFRGRPHIDHMDPLSSGGENSIRNTLYICDKCNYKKGKVLFLTWLKVLTPHYRKLARRVYRQKHGHHPEDFLEGDRLPRTDGISAELELDERDLMEMYPEPIVDGPPSGKQTVVEVSLVDWRGNLKIKDLRSGLRTNEKKKTR
jgi:hypothetical protein